MKIFNFPIDLSFEVPYNKNIEKVIKRKDNKMEIKEGWIISHIYFDDKDSNIPISYGSFDGHLYKTFEEAKEKIKVAVEKANGMNWLWSCPYDEVQPGEPFELASGEEVTLITIERVVCK